MRPGLGILLAFGVCSQILLAGNTGKIAGKVTDKENGGVLPGVNIMIMGTRLGAATNADGRYFIIDVPPGTYQLKISLVGFHSLMIKEVVVSVDLTTQINAKLEQDMIQMPTVELIAEREMVRKDVTSTRKVFGKAEMTSTPGIMSVTDVFKMRTGVSVDQIPTRIPMGNGGQLQVQDESLKNVHVRGGRGGEILYIVDGVPVTHPLYGGRDVLDLKIDDVDQIELLTGAFAAEYGQAQSGVVNITTRSGAKQFEGGGEYKQDVSASFAPGQNSQYVSLFAGGSLGLEAIDDGLGSLFYFVSGNIKRTDGILTLGRKNEDLNMLNLFSLNARQDNSSNLNLKINWELSGRTRFVLSHQGSWKNWSIIPPVYNWLFKDFPNNTAQYSRNTQNWNLKYSYVFSHATVVNLNMGYLSVDYNGSLDGHSNPSDFWIKTTNSTGGDSIYTIAQPPKINPATSFYDETGLQALWRDDLTRTYTAKMELFSQVHPEHIIKTGASVQYNDLRYVDIQDGAFKLSNYGAWKYGSSPYADPPPGPYPEFGQNRWVFHTYPVVGDFYLQDKFEKESLIINIGMRMDWLYLGTQVNDSVYKEKWKAATGMEPEWDLLKVNVSPRFGISFPISERMVSYFSYGHFNQLPELQQYYRDPWSGSLTGNPQIGFEKTVLYEFGFTYQFANDWAVDLKAYGKDLSDQVGTETLKSASGVPVQLYVNNNYGRARGLEVELNKRYSDFTSLNVSYALQWATGYSSTAYSDYIRTVFNLPKPIRERPLDWDIRHQVMLNFTIMSPPGQRISLFGFDIPDNWQLSLLTRFASGLPYTPGTFDPLETRVRENGEVMPYTLTLDLRFNKAFSIPVGELSVFVDVFNLLNRRNPLAVNNWTGEPFKYGDVRGGENNIVGWREATAIMSPTWYGPPREMQLGLRLTFRGN